MKPRPGTIRTANVREKFLEALASFANVTLACKKVGVTRSKIYEWRSEDPSFKKDWDDAIDLGTDSLEDEAVRRAHEGTLKPVYQGGKKVGSIREYSDTLLIFLLKGRRPERFRDKVEHDLTGKLTVEKIERIIVDPANPHS